MSGPIFPMPIDQVREFMGSVLPGASPEVQHVVLSVCEYLKDAQRWQYIKHHVPPDIHKMPPDGLQNHIDYRIGLKK